MHAYKTVDLTWKVSSLGKTSCLLRNHYAHFVLFCKVLTMNFLVAVVNSLNTKTHSSKEMTEFCFKNADVKSICYCRQRMKTKLSLSSECMETKLCKPCTTFTSHPHSSCGMVWYRTLRVKRCKTTFVHTDEGCTNGHVYLINKVKPPSSIQQ